MIIPNILCQYSNNSTLLSPYKSKLESIALTSKAGYFKIFYSLPRSMQSNNFQNSFSQHLSQTILLHEMSLETGKSPLLKEYYRTFQKAIVLVVRSSFTLSWICWETCSLATWNYFCGYSLVTYKIASLHFHIRN